LELHPIIKGAGWAEDGIFEEYDRYVASDIKKGRG
jgi:hypothetical protein